MKRPVKIEFNPRWINAPVGMSFTTHPAVDLGIIFQPRFEVNSDVPIPPILVTLDDGALLEIFPEQPVARLVNG